ncbi:hypothetical protein H7849_18580 [Alloacidobacterium dinghuense]|uniref:Glycine zipper 2TM domain-containing protein n=1 Tax=Alloacidobacterium dinghuense TaxID=2763107 RepID=A0A7G8BEX3_9BACT|nr:hypothetical protein [Alloacidobacterium dinghuense]QNI31093.1 hypothetical protein H7849_18580 [Alloacidobacterium dinghuense]
MRRHSGFTSIVTYAIAALMFVATVISAQAQRIPRGTTIVVRNTDALSSGTATTGQRWSGTLVNDLAVNGEVVAPAGSRVRGTVSDAESSGRLSKPGTLALELTSVNGIPVTTDMYAVDGEGHTKSNVAKIGGGTAVGALLGGIFGGGKGAAIGAAAGAGAGTVGAAATGKKEAKIDAETTLTFKVQ